MDENQLKWEKAEESFLKWISENQHPEELSLEFNLLVELFYLYRERFKKKLRPISKRVQIKLWFLGKRLNEKDWFELEQKILVKIESWRKAKSIEEIQDENLLLYGLRTLNSKIISKLYDEVLPVVVTYVWTRSEPLARHYSETIKDAEDIFQDALIIVCKMYDAGNITHGYNINGLIFNVARNIWLNHLRKEKNRKNYIAEEMKSENSKGIFYPDLLNPFDSESLYLAINLLSRNCQNLIKLRHIEGRSYEEILNEMKYTTIESTRNQVFKCLEKLKTVMKNLK